jgi:ATP-dependent Zn protease
VTGYWNSIKTDRNNRPHISYCDISDSELKYAYFDGNNWNIEKFENVGNISVYNSLALDGKDQPHISFYDQASGDLKYINLPYTENKLDLNNTSKKNRVESNDDFIFKIIFFMATILIIISVLFFYFKKKK